ncbi:hypothetical protein O181_048593 [Austropuccinia psidii MF-1]|uniref:Retrotransposon gag domain-containing protein n=1 Tax=Austropuccinia psidii MF-1 TaxID=1389203 RepID=A0A9Q3DW16_9BASI|nr:hypothetical protein [Austropuccinia psidii MF-1]
MSANLDRGLPMEGEEPSRRGGMKSRRSRSFSGLPGGYPDISQGPRSKLGEGKESEDTEIEASLEDFPKAPEAPNLSLSNKPLITHDEPNFLSMMKQMTQSMGKIIQAVSPRDNPRAPAFKTPSTNSPDSSDGNKAHKIEKTYPILAEKWIEKYLLNISNEDPSYLLNIWKVFETQLVTLYSDPNEVRKAGKVFDKIRMKESGHVSLYIADFQSSIPTIGDWGEKACIYVYRRGLELRLLEQLASHPGNFDSLQELMEITLELDNRYH